MINYNMTLDKFIKYLDDIDSKIKLTNKYYVTLKNRVITPIALSITKLTIKALLDSNGELQIRGENDVD